MARRISNSTRRVQSQIFKEKRRTLRKLHATKRMRERSADDYGYFERVRQESEPVMRASKSRTWYEVLGSDQKPYFLLYSKTDEVIITIYTHEMFLGTYPEFFEGR